MRTIYKRYAIVCAGPKSYDTYSPEGKLLDKDVRSLAKARDNFNRWIAFHELTGDQFDDITLIIAKRMGQG